MENVYTLRVVDILTNKIVQLNPEIDDKYWDTVLRNMFISGRYKVIDGNLPAKWCR